MPFASQNKIDAALEILDREQFIISKDLDERGLGHGLPTEAIIRELLKALPDVGQDIDVMHIGAGSGYLSAVLAKLCHFVVAVERNVQVAELAKRNLQIINQANVSVISDDIANVATLDKPVQCVICTCFLDDVKCLLNFMSEGASLIHFSGEFNTPQLLHYQKERNELKYRGCLGELDFRTHSHLVIDIPRLNDNSSEPVISAVEDKKTLNELYEMLQPELINNYSRNYLEIHRILPIYESDNVITLVTDSEDISYDDLRRMHPCKQVDCRVIPTANFKRLWSHLDVVSRGTEIFHELNEEATPQEDFEKIDTTINPYLVSVYEDLLIEAIGERASDIHLEIYGGHVRVRLRVDGDLHDFTRIQLHGDDYNGLINVIKIRSQLDISERRLPQGGRTKLKYGSEDYDLRVQTQPTLHGEHIIVRLLKHTGRAMTMEGLGMPPKIADYYRRLLKNPVGLVLVVGPTGSGKSTTLYAGLQQLADDGTRKVLTIEDPIEYSIDNVQQSHVKPEIGFTFAQALRAFVRQDPDVILVGEIRDYETALEAIRASQTGHLVLSTLHSNDAVDALQRLYDLQIHPNSIASELIAVIAQRLAKRICPHCKIEDSPNEELLSEVFPDGVPTKFKCYRGKGCEHCGQRGTKGRIAVIEYLYANSDIRKAISNKPDVESLRLTALDSGLITMRDSALAHVISGQIALSELQKILPQDRMSPEKRGE